MQAIEHDVDHATCNVPVKSMPTETRDSEREHVGLWMVTCSTLQAVTLRLDNSTVVGRTFTLRPHRGQSVLTVARPRNQHYLHEVVTVWRPLIFPTSKRRQRSAGTLRVRSLEPDALSRQQAPDRRRRAPV